eukprot:gene16587-biopygen21809
MRAERAVSSHLSHPPHHAEPPDRSDLSDRSDGVQGTNPVLGMERTGRIAQGGAPPPPGPAGSAGSMGSGILKATSPSLGSQRRHAAVSPFPYISLWRHLRRAFVIFRNSARLFRPRRKFLSIFPGRARSGRAWPAGHTPTSRPGPGAREKRQRTRTGRAPDARRTRAARLPYAWRTRAGRAPDARRTRAEAFLPPRGLARGPEGGREPRAVRANGVGRTGATGRTGPLAPIGATFKNDRSRGPESWRLRLREHRSRGFRVH